MIRQGAKAILIAPPVLPAVLLVCAVLFCSCGSPKTSYQSEFLQNLKKLDSSVVRFQIDGGQQKPKKIIRLLKRYQGQASSSKEHIALIKRAKTLQEADGMSAMEYYQFSKQAWEKLPWSEELCALMSYQAILADNREDFFVFSAGLPEGPYAEIVLTGLLHFSLFDTPESASELGDAVQYARDIQRFCLRAGEPGWADAWLLRAVWLSLLAGQNSEAVALLNPLFFDEQLPNEPLVQAAITLYSLADRPDLALELYERQSPGESSLQYAELLWRTGERERAAQQWRNPALSMDYRARYNAAHFAPTAEDVPRLMESLAATGEGSKEHWQSPDHWVSLRILLARLGDEGAESLRATELPDWLPKGEGSDLRTETAASSGAGQNADLRLELESLARMDPSRDIQAILAGYWQAVNTWPESEQAWLTALSWSARYSFYEELSLLIQRADEAGFHCLSLDYYRALNATVQGRLQEARELLTGLAADSQAWRALVDISLISSAQREYRQSLEELALAESLLVREVKAGQASVDEYVDVLERIAGLQEQLGMKSEAQRTRRYARDLLPSSLYLNRLLLLKDLGKL